MHRLLAIADDPTDDDDERLRKRFGVTAGYISVVAPLSVVGEAGERLLAVPLGLSLSLICIANLVVLARTHRFDRYVIVLISAGTVFTVLAIVMGGGVAASGSAMLWAFLVPVYSMLALGPRRATVWFAIFLAALLLIVLVDPIVSQAIAPFPTRFASSRSRSISLAPRRSSSCCFDTRTSDGARHRRAPTSCSTTPYRSRSPPS